MEKAYDECEGLELVSQPKIDIVQLEKGKPFILSRKWVQSQSDNRRIQGSESR